MNPPWRTSCLTIIQQSYRIERNDDQIRVIGANTSGAMYGGLGLVEAIRLGTLGTLKSPENKPRIAKRGIQFNIPLDLHTPSYTESSAAAQAKLPPSLGARFLD